MPPTVANAMFTPLTEAGSYYGINAGDLIDGTYSIDPANSLALDVACNLPQEANSIQVNAKTALKFYFNTEAAGAAQLPFEVPAGSIFQVNNRDALKQFCFVIEATTSFSLQYGSGEGGVPPFFFLTGSGGVTPPPPPGIGAVPTINVVHVMKNEGGQGGDDATGTRNRLDLPYLTIDTAKLALLPGDTLCVWPGNYTMSTFAVDGVTILRLGANLTCASGSLFLADAVSYEVRGSGALTATDAGAYAVRATNAGSIVVDGAITSVGSGCLCGGDSDVVINGDMTSASDAVAVGVGRVTINGQVASTGAYAAITLDPASVLVVNGDVSSDADLGALCDDGVMTINGDVFGETTGVRCVQGVQVVHGDVTSNLDHAARSSGAGRQRIYGNVTSVNGRGAYCQAGVQHVHGDAASTSEAGAVCDDGQQIIDGDVTSEEFYGAWSNGATAEQVIHGDVTGVNNYGAVADLGTQTIDGDVTSNGSGNAAYCGNAIQVIRGSVLMTGVGAAALVNVAGGRQVIWRNVTQTGTGYAVTNIGAYQEVRGDVTGNGIHAVHCVTGAETDIRGDVTTATGAACVVGDGSTLTLRGSVSGEVGNAAVEMYDTTTTLVLFGSAYMASEDGSGRSITDPTTDLPTLRSYGAFGIGTVQIGIVQPVGSSYTVIA